MSRWLSPGVHFKDDPQVRVCARCGYPFPGGRHGAPAACSECGTYIDPTKAGLLRSLAPAMMLQRAKGVESPDALDVVKDSGVEAGAV